MFTLGGGNNDKTREIYERALTAVGIHFLEGELIWQSAYLVEQQVNDNMVSLINFM